MHSSNLEQKKNQTSTMDNISSSDAKDIVRTAEDMAFQFTKDGLKTNQIRNFYSAIVKMRAEFSRNNNQFTDELAADLAMLKPKLAYAAGRQRAVRDNFYPFMKSAIDGVIDSKSMHKFFMLVESIVAYHKFFGDGEK